MVELHTFRITPEMLALIAEIDEFRGAWRELGRLAPDRLRALHRIATIESVGSSTRIEGSKLSDREVEALLGGLETRAFASRDEEEVAGYAAAMETVFSSFESIPLTENHIKQMHSILLQHSQKDARHRGEYKKLPNNVEAFDEDGKSIGIIFETATPFDTPARMEELVAWANDTVQSKALHPLLVIGVFAVTFLAIHPFQDGNGRLSRILTTLLLLQSGYAYVRYSSLESIVEQNKESYYLSLRRTQKTLKEASPDWTPWLTFFLQALQKQKNRLQTKIERERVMRSAMPELSISILDLATEHGQISVADILRTTKAPRGTVKKRLAELIASGHLVRGGKSRATRYSLPAGKSRSE